MKILLLLQMHVSGVISYTADNSLAIIWQKMAMSCFLLMPLYGENAVERKVLTEKNMILLQVT